MAKRESPQSIAVSMRNEKGSNVAQQPSPKMMQRMKRGWYETLVFFKFT
jgi:hypothetical protein